MSHASIGSDRREPPDDDRSFLDRAIALAARGWGRVHPNPMVGCVIVRDGRVVAEGWHAEYGGPHAERVALERAGTAARGATVYVSLEPCGHHGKTPPCADALAEAGVRCVVYALADPAEGAGGAERLRAAGIEVRGPVDTEQSGHDRDPGFFRRARGEPPYVTLKLAVSVDGRIAARPGVRTRLTGSEAHGEVHRWRAGHDAILVGVETVRVDDPLLTARPQGWAPRVQPRRLILDAHLRTPPTARILTGKEPGGEVHLFCSEVASPDRERRLVELGARVHRVAAGAQGGVSIPAVLAICPTIGVHTVFCEGGGRVAGALIRGRHVDRLGVFVAPRLLGGEGVPAFLSSGRMAWKPAAPPRTFGHDVLFLFDPAD